MICCLCLRKPGVEPPLSCAACQASSLLSGTRTIIPLLASNKYTVSCGRCLLRSIVDIDISSIQSIILHLCVLRRCFIILLPILLHQSTLPLLDRQSVCFVLLLRDRTHHVGSLIILKILQDLVHRILCGRRLPTRRRSFFCRLHKRVTLRIKPMIAQDLLLSAHMHVGLGARPSCIIRRCRCLLRFLITRHRRVRISLSAPACVLLLSSHLLYIGYIKASNVILSQLLTFF